MTKMIRTEIDGLTNTAIEIELTPEEIAERETLALQAQEEQAAREDAEAAKVSAKESAQAKLAALGLTTEEISALLS